MTETAFIFPGQGAQYPGMAQDFCQHFACARAVFQEADDLLSSHFSRLIFEGPADVLTKTSNSQLAIFIASIAIWRTVQEQFPHIQPSVSAGLSLGEYTALVASGRISFADALLLVKSRGALMQEACVTSPGTMQVVLGLEDALVEQYISGLKNVWAANFNCPGQVVIAGEASSVEKAALLLKEKGAKRVLPLEVAGAFHTPFMQSARQQLEPQLLAASLQAGHMDLVMNVPGDYVSASEQIRQYLVEQVTSPVRWEKGIRKMEERGIKTFVEMGPGKTLAGMNRKIGVVGATISIEKMVDLEAFHAAATR